MPWQTDEILHTKIEDVATLPAPSAIKLALLIENGLSKPHEWTFLLPIIRQLRSLQFVYHLDQLSPEMTP